MMLQPRPVQQGTSLRTVVTVGAVALAVFGGARILDAENAQAAGASGNLLQLILGQHPHHDPSPWDFGHDPALPVCYQVAKGTGTVTDPCDINPGAGFVPSPWDVDGGPLVHLRPGASCPAVVPDYATCDPSPAGSKP